MDKEILKKINKKNSRKKNTVRKKKVPEKKLKRTLKLASLMIVAMFFISAVFRSVENRFNNSHMDYRDKFIEQLKPVAIEEYKKYRIMPSITIGQAILESNWGKSGLAEKANNLYGIKATKSWKGETIRMRTREYNNQYIYTYFRKYPNYVDSVIDHSRILLDNRAYRNSGFFSKEDYKTQAYALQKAGYATDSDADGNPVYAKKLIDLIEQYRLYEIDSYAKK